LGRKEVEGFCCPVPSEPRLTGARGQDLDSGTHAALRSESNLSRIVVVGNYSVWPDNGGTMPGESTSFTPSSILFRPHQRPPQLQRPLVEAPGTAPGSDGLIPTAIYRHSRTNPAGL